MSNNEIVKNNRVYRIRNMYQPKVWVIQIEVTDTGPGIEPALQEKYLNHLFKVIKHYQEVMVVRD